MVVGRLGIQIGKLPRENCVDHTIERIDDEHNYAARWSIHQDAIAQLSVNGGSRKTLPNIMDWNRSSSVEYGPASDQDGHIELGLIVEAVSYSHRNFIERYWEALIAESEAA